MIDKELLLGISDLKLADKIEQMDEEKLNGYVDSLNEFIDTFPEMEEETKVALGAKNYAYLENYLVNIEAMLKKIFADDLANECAKQISGLANAKHEKIEAFLTYFLTTLSMLSIDIQMATHEDKVVGSKAKAPAKNPAEAILHQYREKKTILAVDDTAFFLSMLKANFQDSDYKLTCVTSGDIALKFLEKNTPDLFLLDIEMPEMDGYTLARKIRAAGQKAPIVFLTGNSKKENVTKALAAGGAGFIVKPINREILTKIAKYV